jgi:hypothetical protein
VLSRLISACTLVPFFVYQNPESNAAFHPSVIMPALLVAQKTQAGADRRRQLIVDEHIRLMAMCPAYAKLFELFGPLGCISAALASDGNTAGVTSLHEKQKLVFLQNNYPLYSPKATESNSTTLAAVGLMTAPDRKGCTSIE